MPLGFLDTFACKVFRLLVINPPLSTDALEFGECPLGFAQ
jgi:hypothetical protein